MHNTKILHLVLLGPPGAGKSTIADLLVAHLPLTIIASGKRLRRELAAQTPLGREIAPLIEQGHFVPDPLIERLMRQWLAAIPAEQGCLLDGYPRTVHQALTLEKLLNDLRRPLDAVICLDIGEAEVLRRLGGRRICAGGGEPFTLHIDDTAAVRRCQERGGTLTRRDDDQPEVIIERLRVYERETAPLIEFFRERNLLHPIDANGSPAEVAQRVLDTIHR